MHMTSAPHLLNEDRPEYERILDEALRTAPDRPELAAVGQRLNTEQLRTMALNATALITAAAAAEYAHYVKVREELREPRPSSSSIREGSGHSAAESGSGGVGLATTMGEIAEPAAVGAGGGGRRRGPRARPRGTAAAIFLLVGYILRMLDPEPAFANTLLTAGWLFGALTAGRHPGRRGGSASDRPAQRLHLTPGEPPRRTAPGGLPGQGGLGPGAP
ncbi:hypothetical protein SALBM135S_07002 [Streptomyces alboniger]